MGWNSVTQVMNTE